MPVNQLVVEFVGPAGAGKTAVLRAIARLAPLVRTGVRIDRLRRLPVLTWGVVALTPVLIDMAFTDARGLWPGLRHLGRLRTLPAEIAHARASNHRAILLDEGPVFSLGRLSVFHNAAAGNGLLARQWHSEVTRWRALLSGIVLLDARNDVLTGRIRGRVKDHPVKNRSDREVGEFLDRYRAAYREVVTRLTADGRVQLVELDTSTAPIERVAADALSALDDWSRRFGVAIPDEGS